MGAQHVFSQCKVSGRERDNNEDPGLPWTLSPSLQTRSWVTIQFYFKNY